MRQLVILSGKGGRGKTSVAAALAHLASQDRPIVLANADVDAANLELVLEPAKLEEHVFMGGQAAIEAYCTAEGIGVVGRLPFDTVVTEAMVQGQPVTAYQPDGAVAAALREAWARVRRWVEE